MGFIACMLVTQGFIKGLRNKILGDWSTWEPSIKTIYDHRGLPPDAGTFRIDPTYSAVLLIELSKFYPTKARKLRDGALHFNLSLSCLSTSNFP